MACNTQPSWVYIPCNICIAYTIYCALRIKQDFKWALPPGDTWPDTTCKQPFPSPQTTTTTRGFTGIQKLQVFVQSRGSNQILAGLTINQKYITFYFLVFCLWLASCWLLVATLFWNVGEKKTGLWSVVSLLSLAPIWLVGCLPTEGGSQWQ